MGREENEVNEMKKNTAKSTNNHLNLNINLSSSNLHALAREAPFRCWNGEKKTEKEKLTI